MALALGAALMVLALLPLAALTRIPAVVWRKRRGIGTTAWHEVGVVLFLSCIGVVLSVTLGAYLLSYIRTGGATGAYSTLNLMPFAGIRRVLRAGEIYGGRYVFNNIAGNILMFLPVGFLPPLVWRGMGRVWPTLFLGLGFSLFIEGVQYFIGGNTDVDDLILNFTGCLVGVLVYAFVRALAPRFLEQCRVRRNDAYAKGRRKQARRER